MPLQLEDVQTHELTEETSTKLGIEGHGLIGVPVYKEGGDAFGTLCALSSSRRTFTEKEQSLMETMARLLQSVLSVDEERDRLTYAEVPIVTLAPGTAILPLTGEMTKERAAVVMDQVLRSVSEEGYDHLILDISGLVRKSEAMTARIMELADSLELIGAGTVLTGVRPDQARELHAQMMQSCRIRIAPSMQEALRITGWTIQPSQSSVEKKASAGTRIRL
ncbi:STAS domain-containing protein [Alkalicoccus chagannorensis]|uniref:STAS domain-containing protein n=1 Tax=Alkalicoccus chagannorensis TaxID=427072 RepID=UPI000426FD13|nr:STAS domain-containing protein [Alkalicoccus chagannorensis]